MASLLCTNLSETILTHIYNCHKTKVLICPYPEQCKHLLATACLCLSAVSQFALYLS